MRKRQWGIRVGTPENIEKGFITIPLGMWALWATIAMGWAMIWEISTHAGATESRWY